MAIFASIPQATEADGVKANKAYAEAQSFLA